MNDLSEDLLNQMPGGYFYFAEGNCLVSINQTLLDQLGYTALEVIGQSVEELLTIASRIFYQTHIYPLLKLQGKADEVFLSLRMKNGQPLPSYSMRLGSSGAISTFTSVFACRYASGKSTKKKFYRLNARHNWPLVKIKNCSKPNKD